MAGAFVPNPINGQDMRDFRCLWDDNYRHISTFLSQRKVGMMVHASSARSGPWREALAHNSTVLAAKCKRHEGSSCHGHAIFDLFLCGNCEKKVCDLCVRKRGMWCGGMTGLIGCPGYGISDEGLHDRTPLCHLCAVQGGNNKQMCVACYSDDEREITGNYDEDSDEEIWSDEDLNEH